MSRPQLPPAAIDYPESDGKPLAENDPQLHAIHYAFGALLLRYAARADVYVSADLLVYYEEGNPRVSVAPDVFVVFGVEDRMRGNYKVWEEGKGPDFVLEVASPVACRPGARGDAQPRTGRHCRSISVRNRTGCSRQCRRNGSSAGRSPPAVQGREIVTPDAASQGNAPPPKSIDSLDTPRMFISRSWRFPLTMVSMSGYRISPSST